MPFNPSYFLGLGVPYCSVFRESKHEQAALLYLEYLVSTGDKWQSEFDENAFVKEMATKLPQGIDYRNEIVRRVKLAADQLKTEEEARRFSPAWNK